MRPTTHQKSLFNDIYLKDTLGRYNPIDHISYIAHKHTASILQKIRISIAYPGSNVACLDISLKSMDFTMYYKPTAFHSLLQIQLFTAQIPSQTYLQ